jgi:hypothetical protein
MNAIYIVNTYKKNQSFIMNVNLKFTPLTLGKIHVGLFLISIGWSKTSRSTLSLTAETVECQKTTTNQWSTQQ